MHYYKRNLGDYAKKCGRLTMLQHGAYTLLIDSCYDREIFPTFEQAIEWTWASTDQEIEAVLFVLSRFFTLTEGGQYVQDRILQEVLEYHSKADKNKQIAIDRETKRRENSTNRVPDVNETPPNQEPRTKNHKPLTNIKTIQAPEGVSISVWEDFVLQRKKARAVISENVLKSIEKEAHKAGWSLEQALAECAARGWRGFKAEWVNKTDAKKDQMQNFMEQVNNFGNFSQLKVLK